MDWLLNVLFIYPEDGGLWTSFVYHSENIILCNYFSFETRLPTISKGYMINAMTNIALHYNYNLVNAEKIIFSITRLYVNTTFQLYDIAYNR